MEGGTSHNRMMFDSMMRMTGIDSFPVRIPAGLSCNQTPLPLGLPTAEQFGVEARSRQSLKECRVAG